MPINNTVFPWENITNKPSKYPPSSHANSHLPNGSDPITFIKPSEPNFDSGWTPFTGGNTYALNHNLNKIPSHIMVLFRKDNTFSSYTVMEFDRWATSYGGNFSVNDTQIKIVFAAGNSGYSPPPFSSALGSTDTMSIQEGEFRIFAWK